MKINNFQIENTKRVKAVRVKPTQNGLTVIGGKNNQGKTSVLDAIAWALGGNRFKPSSPQHDDSILPPKIKIVMDNGLVVERKGKNSDLKVIDPSGEKGGQALLDSFVEELALDLSKFMRSNNKEKADILLRIIGVGEQLFELEQQEQATYNKRHAIGQIADQKQKFADEQTFYPDAPDDLVSASELIKQQQTILAKNGKNQEYRNNLKNLEITHQNQSEEHARLTERIKQLEADLAATNEALIAARKTAAELQDESTAEIEQSINDVEKINIKVRANFDKQKAEDDAKEYKNQYDSLSSELNKIRKAKTDLLTNADLPLKDLSVEDGELIYQSKKWDSMSGSDQLKVATAIIRKLKPNCQFVLIDKLEQMDLDTLEEFGKWLETEGLQAIATRVSTGDECSIIIEDGYVKGEEILIEELQQAQKKWEAGKF